MCDAEVDPTDRTAAFSETAEERRRTHMLKNYEVQSATIEDCIKSAGGLVERV